MERTGRIKGKKIGRKHVHFFSRTIQKINKFYKKNALLSKKKKELEEFWLFQDFNNKDKRSKSK